MCHTCAGRGFNLSPLPESLDEFRERLARNRRLNERRAGQRDRRIFQIDRRLADRRLGGTTYGEEWFDAAELVVETLDDHLEGDATRIARIF
jgi:hypothetical protein